MDNVWEDARLHLRNAGVEMGLSLEVIDVLSTPMQVTEYGIPLRMDDGRTRVFTAYRVRHNDALGPTKDGTRIRPDLDLEEMKALALFMTLKHSIADIPAGGGKGGIVADPRDLSTWELERLCRAYIRRLTPKGAWADVPGADIGTNLQTQAWMLDEYEQITGQHCPAAINDKPVGVGGSLGGDEATGRGVFYVTLQALKDAGKDVRDCRIVVQGFGQVGSHAARLLHAEGARVIGIGDIYGSIHNPEGLDIVALLDHVKKTGSAVGFEGGSAIEKEAVLELDCDVLIPAAIHGVINEGNASRVRAKLIVEAANGPITATADEVLDSMGITVVPDILANSGGVIVCSFERTQGLTDFYWDAETVRQRLKERILGAYEEVKRISAERGISLRDAAWVKGLEKIARVMKMRGWVTQ